MGRLVNVHCRGCQKQWQLYEGVGMFGFARNMRLIEKIKLGQIKNERAQQLLELGAKAVPDEYRDAFFRCYGNGAIFVCEKCKDFRHSNDLFFKVNVKTLTWKRLTYDAWFPFGNPRCKECDSELKFIRNVRSSKVKCPRCGGILSVKNVGYFD